MTTSLTERIGRTWDRMYSTVGQDQWPCDVLLSLKNELAGGAKSGYSTAKLKEMTGDLMHLTVGDAAKDVMAEALTAIYAARLLKGGRREAKR